MSNMSYCRFRNTLKDLQDCYDNWDNETSFEEEVSKEKLVNLCQDIISDYSEEEDV